MKEVIGNLDYMMTNRFGDSSNPFPSEEWKLFVLTHTINEYIDQPDYRRLNPKKNGKDKCLHYYLNFLREDDSQSNQKPLTQLSDHYVKFCKVMTVEYVLQRLAKLRPEIISAYEENMWISHGRYWEENIILNEEYDELNSYELKTKDNYSEVWESQTLEKLSEGIIF